MPFPCSCTCTLQLVVPSESSGPSPSGHIFLTGYGPRALALSNRCLDKIRLPLITFHCLDFSDPPDPAATLVPLGFLQMSFNFPPDAMLWIAVNRRLAPFYDQGDLLRITDILSYVFARCPSAGLAVLHYTPDLSSMSSVLSSSSARGFTELHIPMPFCHIDLGPPRTCIGFIDLFGMYRVIESGGSIYLLRSSWLPLATPLPPPFPIIPWVISLTSVHLGVSCRTARLALHFDPLGFLGNAFPLRLTRCASSSLSGVP